MTTEAPIKDIDSNLWEDYWYNKLYIVIGIRGINYLALYRHDNEIKLVEIDEIERRTIPSSSNDPDLDIEAPALQYANEGFGWLKKN